ncbi:hypothetical protein FJTKL_01844 [Diaporthe vaccinii]|uniref:Uncharacterized protein n=1 Tax=Diaporthe vaccinii TaxID=105482 RepID=A0ABR4F4I0_9PEZI
MTTIDILGRGRSLQVGEPKDKIYALMHLLTSGGKTLQPDYAATTSHLDVYRDFAIKYTEDKADLDLLNCVEHNQNTFDQETIPSWVPRWDVGGHPEPMLNPMDRIITGDTSQDYPAVQSFTATAGGSALRNREGPVLDFLFGSVREVSMPQISHFRTMPSVEARRTSDKVVVDATMK